MEALQQESFPGSLAAAFLPQAVDLAVLAPLAKKLSTAHPLRLP